MIPKSIIYDNRTFTLGTAKRYYFTHVKGKSWSLHRYKYTKEKGPIPDKWHIHHIDGNCFNNDIENLIIIEPNVHSKLHIPSQETVDKWQQAGIKAAPAWHASEEGKEWHRNQYQIIKDRFHEVHERKCTNCGKSVFNKHKIANVFCCGTCKTKYRINSGVDNEIRICGYCKKEFKVNKYRKVKFCSRSCGHIGKRWKQNKKIPT